MSGSTEKTTNRHWVGEGNAFAYPGYETFFQCSHE